jgi:hypothetical protein
MQTKNTQPPAGPQCASAPVSLADFDEQRWPVNLLLLLFAACIAAMIVVTSDFNSPRWLANGWFHLGALAALVAVLAWAMVRFEDRMRRRMQLGVFLSLLVHLWLCMISYHIYLSALARREKDAPEAIEEPAPVTLPDYHWQDESQDDATDPTLETPVETALPQTEQEIERTEPIEPPKERPAEIEPEVPPVPVVPAAIERTEMSAPRRADELAGRQISRQDHRLADTNEQAAVPTLEEASEKSMESAAHVERTAPNPARIARQSESVNESASLPTESSLSRNERSISRSQPRVDSRMDAKLAKSVSTPEAAARPIATARAQAAAESSQLMETRLEAVARAQASLPNTSALMASESKAFAATTVTAGSPADVGTVGQLASAEPSVSSAASSTPSRRIASATSGEASTIESPASSLATASDQPTAQPASAALTKASGGAAGLTRQQQFDSEQPGATANVTARSAARRSQAVQNLENGSAAAPSEPARLPKARAGAEVPTASFRADDTLVADVAGSTRPAATEASSSAAVERMAAAAPRGRITAAAGAGVVDQGAPRVSSPIGEGRTSGGGEPSLTSGETQAKLAKASPTANARGMASQVGADVPGPRGMSGSPDKPAPNFAQDNIVRQSPAILPVAGAMAGLGEIGGGAIGAAAIGQPSQRQSNEEPTIDAGSAGGMARGKSTGAAASVEVGLVDDFGGVVASGTAKGALTAMADLPGGRRASALPVLAAAPLGAGGLTVNPAYDVGVPSRRARPESETAHLHSGRLILERSGANRAADVRVQDVAVPGFRQRDRQLREELARQRGGSEGSERAVEMGLDFLARHQNVNGSWSLQRFSQGGAGYENAGDGQMVSDTAGTGLAMLAFLGAGYTHTDGKYRLLVGRGLNYLLGNQRANGDLFLPQETKSNLNVWLYSHGIASIALCEAYGMTRDPGLKPPAQRALDFIVAAQHPTDGGWRYAPRQGSDTSVSGWQLMALKSGELAGLAVPAATYAKVSRWLDGAQAQGNRAQYVYRPKARQPHQRVASRVMTAEALLMRQYLGWKRDNASMADGADLIMKELPEWSTERGWQRDSYYWYYATQVMFQMGGQHWDAWNERLRPLLVEKQVAEGPFAGSWEPLGDVPDRWGREGGRIYVTAMHLLMLEVYYRHLPLYQSLNEFTPQPNASPGKE